VVRKSRKKIRAAFPDHKNKIGLFLAGGISSLPQISQSYFQQLLLTIKNKPILIWLAFTDR
jgi:hypothetical protein